MLEFGLYLDPIGEETEDFKDDRCDRFIESIPNFKYATSGNSFGEFVPIGTLG